MKINIPKIIAIFLIIPVGIVVIISILLFIIPSNESIESVKTILSITGTLGDTLGGITSCLISGLTLYYLISTFKDQSSINEHSRSSNNFGIYYDLLKKIESKIENLEISYTDSNNTTIKEKGLNSVNIFSQTIEINASDIGLFMRFNDLDIEFFKESTEILSDLAFFYRNQDSLKLKDEHKEILLKEFIRIFEIYFNQVRRLNYTINYHYTFIDENNLVPNQILNINRLLPVSIKYQECIEELEKLGLIDINIESDDTPDESLLAFFRSPELNSDSLEKIKTNIRIELKNFKH